jgi:hypothetical protein
MFHRKKSEMYSLPVVDRRDIVLRYPSGTELGITHKLNRMSEYNGLENVQCYIQTVDPE